MPAGWEPGSHSLLADLALMHQYPIAAWQGFFEGASHGSAMIANAATFHQIDALDSYVDNLVNTYGSTYGWANFAAHAGVYAGYAALALLAYQAAGGATYGVGIVNTSETSVVFQVTTGAGTEVYMGAANGVYRVTGAGWLQFNYWRTITGIPIINPGAAALGGGSSVWCANHPCFSHAVQGFINGWLPWR